MVPETDLQNRPQSWACLLLFLLYSLPKVLISSTVPIKTLPFQLKSSLLCEAFPSVLARN